MDNRTEIWLKHNAIKLEWLTICTRKQRGIVQCIFLHLFWAKNISPKTSTWNHGVIFGTNITFRQDFSHTCRNCFLYRIFDFSNSRITVLIAITQHTDYTKFLLTGICFELLFQLRDPRQRWHNNALPIYYTRSFTVYPPSESTVGRSMPSNSTGSKRAGTDRNARSWSTVGDKAEYKSIL